MKILITTDTYEPMINGVVESVKNLKRELSMRGHDVRILALSDDLHSKVIGDVYYIKSFDIYVYPKARGTIPIERYCRKMIEKWKPDIIHSQTEFFTLTVAKRIALDLDIPIIHTYHTMYEYYTEYLFKTDKVGKSAAKFLTKHALAYVDAVIAPTEKVKEVLEKYKIHQPISVIPTGIDLSGFKNTKNVDFSKINSLKNKYKITDKEKVMITVGRIGAEKNLDEILDNLTVFTQTHKDFVWLIVGDGPYLPTLKSRVLRLNLEKYVKFAGMISHEEVPLYYRMSDLYVNASISETQGLTYIEALSSDLPILCRKDSCLDEIMCEGENGFYFSNQNEFLEKLDKIMQDEKLRSNMSENASKSAEKYSAAEFAKNVEKAYLETLRAYHIKRRIKANTLKGKTAGALRHIKMAVKNKIY